MRLDKYLAHAGIGTRKEVKGLIRKGYVSVNGLLCKKDDAHIDEEHDQIVVDGEVIDFETQVYIMLYKPDGVVSATQDKEHSTVLDCIDTILPPDCFPVGRLDIDSEGLLFITNDGKLAHRLLSPKHHVPKVYYVEMASALSQADILTLCNGSIVLDEQTIQHAQLDMVSDTSCHITIQEGRYHQIKRMFHAVQNEVLYLKRIQMGPLHLDRSLQVGEWRYLTESEIQALKAVL